jgi:multisubunit Na+/H+ antiporter MnhG subunit
MKFGEVAGWVNTRLILGLLFYLIITPIALLLKLIGKDLIDTKLDNSRASYRTTRELQDKNHMENPY